MNDFLEREINVGDSVIFVAPYERQLMLGKVIKITPKNVRVAYRVTHGYYKGNEDSVIRPPKDIVKVDGPDLTRYILMTGD